ncbi:MAG: deoxyguanosinetriphosphate triphosphohydrolase [candidate division Zixibacteria bacterium]|nr:deoxyguanosinetriphosphate triphosphohydrolase [candidate division Zixibacteria bacterium]
MSRLPLNREDIEKREKATLGPYAALSGESKGRVYPQEEHPLRTSFQRDRDRIVHSAAFRRMEYKTQVFIPHEKDHYRTRLTHTIEVAQISRTLARNLLLNEDLAEAIALVHDVGHTPFGHAGEDVLNGLLKKSGGFNHNRQSLRVVDVLERRYPEHPGLNLSYEVREGIVKHETTVKIDIPEFNPGQQPTLEAALVDIADEIAYNSHDIDDGLSSGLITFDDLHDTQFFKFPGMDTGSPRGDDEAGYRRYALIRQLVNRMTTDVVEETRRRLNRQDIRTLNDVRNSSEKLCGYSAQMAQMVLEIKQFLLDHLYRNSHLVSLSDWAAEIIQFLFRTFAADMSLLPSRFQKMLDGEKPDIVIADYIAGMTDRYATEKYGQLRGR